MLRNFIKQVGGILLLSCFLYTTHALDEIDASYDPPGGLDPQKVPLLFNIGFDDNRYPDAMTWILDFIEDKKNPAGIGNGATFDGQPIKVSFYFISSAMEDVGDSLVETWQRAKDAGHEIANHTHTHDDLRDAPTSLWLEEMGICNSLLIDKLQVTEEEIWGFRTPYLAYNSNMYSALDQNSLLYDCTIMHMPEPYDVVFLWPYTLHNDLHPSTQRSVGNHPGIWEIPVYNVLLHSSGYPHMCGFDDSIFRQQKTAEEFLDILKWSLDIRLQDGKNRAPFTLGAHTDIYSPNNADAAVFDTWGAPLAKRRKAMEDFITYALAKPDVRFVTAKQIIQWMRNPVALDEVTPVAMGEGKSSVRSFIITNVTPEMISFSVSQPSYYSLSLYSVQGEKLGKVHTFCKQGQNRISLNSFSLARGTYLLKVNGLGVSLARKFVLYEQ